MLMEEIKEQIIEYPYALIYLYSDLILQETGKLDDIPWNECIEGRFFGTGNELRIWREGNGFKTVVYKGCGEHLDETYNLNKRYEDLGKAVIVRKFLDYDKDGQVYVKGTVLAGLER